MSDDLTKALRRKEQHPIVTGWCQRAEHDRCDGQLHGHTGYDWFCACTCHDVPAATEVSS